MDEPDVSAAARVRLLSVAGAYGGLRLPAFAHRLLELGGLFEFLDDARALQPRNMVDEQDAVQMVDLMLQAGCQNAVGLDLPGAAVSVEIADAHTRGTLDLFVIFRNR